MPKYPNTGFLEKVLITWLTIPNAGKIRIYTSGCPKNLLSTTLAFDKSLPFLCREPTVH
jgi:hypothetical protein